MSFSHLFPASVKLLNDFFSEGILQVWIQYHVEGGGMKVCSNGCGQWWSCPYIVKSTVKVFKSKKETESLNTGSAMWKCFFRHMLTAKTQISLHINAVWSGPSLSTKSVFGYYKMYEWRAKAQLILCTCTGCTGWFESAYFFAPPPSPRQGTSNEYPQSLYVLSSDMKNIRIFYLKIFIFWK